MPPTSPSRRIFAPTCTNAWQGGSMAGARSSTRSSATTSNRPIVPSSRLGRPATDRLAASGLRAYARGDTLAAADLLERATSLLPADDPGRLSLLPPLGRAFREAGRM